MSSMNREIRTILLAEDSPADAEMAMDALREANLANPIIHVEDGVEALDFLYCRGSFASRTELAPAVVLLDIKMPRLDGLEVLKQMRGDEAFKHVRNTLIADDAFQIQQGVASPHPGRRGRSTGRGTGH